MSKKANPAIIGAFTLIGLLIAAAFVVLFGAGKMFRKTQSIQLYFDKSAYGLQVGSDVRFGGVRIGSVKSIGVLFDTERDRKIIPVVVELGERELGKIGIGEGGGINFSTEKGVNRAVKQGLRAGMKQQSLLTGQLYIEFDVNPNEPGFVFHPSEKPDFPVVPTIGTELDELIAGIGDGIKKINALDLEGMIEDMRDVLTTTQERIAAVDVETINQNIIAITDDVRKITNDERLPAALDNLNSTLAEIEAFAAKANEGVNPLLENLNQSIEQVRASLVQLDDATKEISGFSHPRGPVMQRMNQAISEAERASRALKELSNDLKRDPKAILTGRETPE